MKPSPQDTGSPRVLFTRRLKALLPQGRKKTHRFSANVTGEEDWEVDEPQIRMSRAFAVMLVLHLVAVGGLFAFHMFGRDDREAEAIATRGAHENSPPPPVIAAAKPATPAVAPTPVVPKAEVVLDEPAADSAEREHLFKNGETKMLVAAKFGITVRELEEANPASQFKAGEKLSIPQHQRVIGALAGNSAPVNPPLALIEPTPSDDVGHREFALKKEDNPYSPVLPAGIEPERAEPMAPRVKVVSAAPQENVDAMTPEETDADNEVAAPAPKVKKQTAAAPVPAPAPVKPKPTTGSRTHVVGKGDTVYNVAKRFGLSPNEIMRANGISDPSRLQMGQVLKITVKR